MTCTGFLLDFLIQRCHKTSGCNLWNEVMNLGSVRGKESCSLESYIHKQ